jgi:EmrB/QacA subfamily drug resistance transporter
VVAGAFFMENLDGTVIATALPAMARSFAVPPVSLSLGITAYLLTLAVLIPASGWTADRFGTRRVFTSAIAVFTVASVLCGLCTGLWPFVAARVLQGVGGAMMVPVGRLSVLRSTEKRDLVRAVAFLTWPGLAAPVIGPPLGGFITAALGWRWIFLLNLPLGLVGLACALRFIPDIRAAERRPFDGVGFVLGGAALLALMGGLDALGRPGAALGPGAALALAGLALGALAVRHAQRHAAPLIDLAAMRVPSFAATSTGGLLFRAGITSAPFLLPLMFQLGFGLSPVASGSLLLAVFAGNLGMKTFTTPILRRFGFRSVLVGNGVLAAASLLAVCVLDPATPRALVLAVLFAGGLCRSMQFTALNTLSYADVPQRLMSGANTLGSVLQQGSSGLGVAVGALALRAASALHGAPGPGAGEFRLAFAVMAAMTLLGLLPILRLPADVGAEVSGHRTVRA